VSKWPPQIKDEEYRHVLVTEVVHAALLAGSEPEIRGDCILCHEDMTPAHANVAAYSVCDRCLWIIHAAAVTPS